MLALVAIVLVLLVAIVARGIIGALNKATSFDENLLQPETVHLNKADLEKAYDSAQGEKFTNLDL